MQRRGQFDDAKASAEMSARDRNGIDGFLTQLIGDLTDLFHLEPAQIVRGVDGVEKRCFAKYGHGDIPILQVGIKSPTRDGVRRVSAAKTQTPDAT
jgi:hypothetical protein